MLPEEADVRQEVETEIAAQNNRPNACVSRGAAVPEAHFPPQACHECREPPVSGSVPEPACFVEGSTSPFSRAALLGLFLFLE